MPVTWPQALALRTERQFLAPTAEAPVEDVVRRLGAVLSMDERAAEIAVGMRRRSGRVGDLAEAVADGRVVKAFAFRGAVHHMAPDDAGAYLALRGAGRQWELRSWCDHYGLEPGDWPAFRATVREAVADGPLTITEVGLAVTRRARYRHLRGVFDDGAGTLVKPLTWQGDVSIAPSRDGELTLQTLADNPRWAGVWELDDAGPYAVESYLRAYGPVGAEQVQTWFGGGLSAGRKRIDGWLAGLGDRVAEVGIEGRTVLVLAEDLDALRAARPSRAVLLVPGHDQWVMGPGTKDEVVVPAGVRDVVTRKANLVLAGGVVSGTWRLRGDAVELTWLSGGRIPRTALEDQVDRLGTLLGRPLSAVIDGA